MHVTLGTNNNSHKEKDAIGAAAKLASSPAFLNAYNANPQMVKAALNTYIAKTTLDGNKDMRNFCKELLFGLNNKSTDITDNGTKGLDLMV